MDANVNRMCSVTCNGNGLEVSALSISGSDLWMGQCMGLARISLKWDGVRGCLANTLKNIINHFITKWSFSTIFSFVLFSLYEKDSFTLLNLNV